MTNDEIKRVLFSQKTTGAEATYDALVQIVPEVGERLSYQQFYMLTMMMRGEAVAKAKQQEVGE